MWFYKYKILVKAAVLNIIFIMFCNAGFCQALSTDTIFFHYNKDVLNPPSRSYAYDQTLVLKLFCSQALFDGKYKRRDNGKSEVYQTFSSALDVIKRIDKLTLGIPKIVYLVGWQYNGHDSKYPAFFDANKRLKRPQDSTANQSLKWLMKEAFKYHTTVSLHINMLDAYEDSPLWDEYVKYNIIAKAKDGTILKSEWGSPVSYAKEWSLGYTQKRIDSLCRLLPIEKAGTIHIDAFHTYPPLIKKDSSGKDYVDLSPKIISPYLSYTIADEQKAQENIFNYFNSKHIDVTSEGVDFLRPTSFEGLQPMAWWFPGELNNYLKWPASYYCGGVDESEWGQLFGTSMHGEDIIKKDPKNLKGWKEQFCTHTLVWMYLNKLNRLFLIQSKTGKQMHYENKVVVKLNNDNYRIITAGMATLVNGEDVLMPAVWITKPALIAYSKNGYSEKSWQLPGKFSRYKNFKMYKVTQQGNQLLRTLHATNEKLVLTVPPDEMLLLEAY